MNELPDWLGHSGTRVLFMSPIRLSLTSSWLLTVMSLFDRSSDAENGCLKAEATVTDIIIGPGYMPHCLIQCDLEYSRQSVPNTGS
jgi:hypothetical protein